MHNEINLPRVAQTLDFTCGPACFESMFQYLDGRSMGELHFANLLGTLETGYTAPEKLADLANAFGFHVVMKRSALFTDIQDALIQGKVIFVTWWYEDSGHYSLVKSISNHQVILMDPWLARDEKDNVVDIKNFCEFWNSRGAVMITVSN